MSIRQTLTSARNGTVWSRREGDLTYFLRKTATGYEVWNSLASGSKSPVTLDQAVTFYSQRNLINSTDAARPEPTAPTRPAPPPPPPPPRPSADQQLQSIRNGGTIFVNATTSIVFEDGQYLIFNPRNASLTDIRIRTAAEIAAGNASPITLAQAKAAITNGAKNTTSAPTTTRTPAPAASPKTAPARTSAPTTTRTPAPAPTPKTKAPTSFDSPTPTPAPTPAPVARPAPVAVASEPPLPPVKLAPVTVDIPTFDRRGRQTGTQQVTIESPPIPATVGLQDPGSLATPIDQAELAALAAQAAADASAAVTAAEEELKAQDQFIFQARKDWRVRLALSDAPEVNYLYRAPNPGILNPLNATNGVLFPYTPTISVNYSANYNPTELVHSNYKVFQYSSSSIDSVTIACDFTAQSTYEADYLLAVIHFFRSATKMFYGQDENPRRGTPPPLCYIYGMGSYQFAGQPLAISQFSYNLPNNVDYIKTSVSGAAAPLSLPSRLDGTFCAPGGVLPPPNFTPIQEPDTISWVPSKIQLSITCVPMLSRNAVSNRFSLEQYATGALLNGIGKPGGGFW